MNTVVDEIKNLLAYLDGRESILKDQLDLTKPLPDNTVMNMQRIEDFARLSEIMLLTSCLKKILHLAESNKMPIGIEIDKFQDFRIIKSANQYVLYGTIGGQIKQYISTFDDQKSAEDLYKRMMGKVYVDPIYMIINQIPMYGK